MNFFSEHRYCRGAGVARIIKSITSVCKENLMCFYSLGANGVYKLCMGDFFPLGILDFAMRDMVPVPTISSAFGLFYPIPRGKRRPNSLESPRSRSCLSSLVRSV